jgi:class 3 adenylate cyclase
MSDSNFEVAVLMADISGSTALYEDVGDTEALRLVGICLDNLKSVVEHEGGTFIRSKGDDVLAVFADASDALRAGRTMLSKETTGSSLGVHLGASFGRVIRARGDVFGDSVHTTARLASLAKPGEILVSHAFVEQLPESESRELQPLDNITLKGKDASTRVYAFLEANTSLRTVLVADQMVEGEGAGQAIAVTLRYADKVITCPERTDLSIGRAAGNDVVIERKWISREHARLHVREGKVQLADRSSSGTYVSVDQGYEFLIKRETVLLTGSGTICPGIRPELPEAEIIHYEVSISESEASS